MKKTILFSIFFLFFGLAPHVFAEGFVALAPIPGLTDIQYAPNGLADFFNNLYKYLIGLAAVLAVIEIIWGGLEYSTQDSVSKKSDGKERIYQAIFGLVLVLSPVLVFSIINPSILNLSLNLDPLKTAPGASTGTGSGPGGGAAVAPVSGCTTSGTVLIKASCSTTEEANASIGTCPPGNGYIPFNTAPKTCSLVSGKEVCTQPVLGICEKKLEGTFPVVDLGSKILGIGYMRLKGVGTNADQYTSFATACKNDGGDFCGSRSSSVACPSTLNITNLGSGQGTCYELTSLYCRGAIDHKCSFGEEKITLP